MKDMAVIMCEEMLEERSGTGSASSAGQYAKRMGGAAAGVVGSISAVGHGIDTPTVSNFLYNYGGGDAFNVLGLMAAGAATIGAVLGKTAETRINRFAHQCKAMTGPKKAVCQKDMTKFMISQVKSAIPKAKDEKQAKKLKASLVKYQAALKFLENKARSAEAKVAGKATKYDKKLGKKVLGSKLKTGRAPTKDSSVSDYEKNESVNGIFVADSNEHLQEAAKYGLLKGALVIPHFLSAIGAAKRINNLVHHCNDYGKNTKEYHLCRLAIVKKLQGIVGPETRQNRDVKAAAKAAKYLSYLNQFEKELQQKAKEANG